MERCRDLYGNNQGERLDTIEGPYDLYDQEDDAQDDFAQMNDNSSDEGDLTKNKKKRLNQSHD